MWVVSAISAYVLNPNLWVLHRPVRDRFKNVSITDWMSETMEQRVGHNPSLTSWGGLDKNSIYFLDASMYIGDCILQKRRSLGIKLITTTISADTMSLLIYMKKLKMITFAEGCLRLQGLRTCLWCYQVCHMI